MLTSASVIWGYLPNENPSRNTTHVAQVGRQQVSVSFFFFLIFIIYLGFPGGSVVKNLSMQETGVWSLGWEDPLEKEMATCFSSLASKMPWTEEHGGLQSMGSQSVGHDWAPEHIYLFGCVRSQLRHLGIFAACGIIRCHIQTLSNCSTRA